MFNSKCVQYKQIKISTVEIEERRERERERERETNDKILNQTCFEIDFEGKLGVARE